MAQFSVAVRNGRLNSIPTAIGASARLKVRSGAMPANCATADAGTVLADATLPATYFNAAASAVMSKTGTWQDLSADATGLVGHYRIYETTGVTCHMQGLLAQNWQASTGFALNQQVYNGGNVYKATTAGTTAASGGPTGTGSGITDGTAVWAYVGLVDMTIDNGSLAATQAFTISTYQITDGNA